MLIVLTGKPGMGKTLTLTDIAYKSFKKYNPPFKVWFTEHILRKKYVYTLNQYSDYPIVFKRPKKGKIYYYYDESGNVVPTDCICSLQMRIFDLILDNKFVPNASFYFDEIQAKYDSMEYKDFPDCIAHYCQAHRHFDNDIYVSSQSQSRIIKRILVLAEEYWEVVKFRKLFGFAFLTIRKTWEMRNSLDSSPVSSLDLDCDYVRLCFRLSRVGNLYDSKYLRNLQSDSVIYKSIPYHSLQLSKDILLSSFFPTNEEREQLRRKRY